LNPVALITGGGNGIGRAVAQRMAVSGMTVVVADCEYAAAEQVRAEVEEAGGKAAALSLDVTVARDVKAAVGEVARPLVRALEALVKVMLQVTDYVMRFAPVAVFAAVTASIAERGPSMLKTYGFFMGSFYVGLVILWALLIGICFLVVGSRTRLLVRYIRDPIVLAFSTASSEAAFPRTLEALDRFGVPPRIASFVLPLGYSFNLDGSMMYMTFASIFIAQAYGIHLDLGTQIAMLLYLMVSSKGVAGVPRASLVVITATLAIFKIPEAGILMILAVDHFLDMGRSATNVVGNAVAASVVARWEGALDAPEPADIEPPHAPSHVKRAGKIDDHF